LLAIGSIENLLKKFRWADVNCVGYGASLYHVRRNIDTPPGLRSRRARRQAAAFR